MSTTVPVDMQDLAKPRWKKRDVTFWKGDNPGGWQICMDEKRTGGHVGKILPVLIEYPVGGQHEVTFTVKETNEHGEEIERLAHIWEVKGWKRLSEMGDPKPSKAMADFLLERAVKEIEQTMKEAKAKPEEIRAEQDAFRALVYEVNGFGEPQMAPIDRVKKQRAKGGG